MVDKMTESFVQQDLLHLVDKAMAAQKVRGTEAADEVLALQGYVDVVHNAGGVIDIRVSRRADGVVRLTGTVVPR